MKTACSLHVPRPSNLCVTKRSAERRMGPNFFYLDYLLSTPFSLHIETPIYLAAPLICKKSSKVEEVNPSNKSDFELVNEKDKGQDTDNIYLLAKRHIASGAPTDAIVINQYLSEFSLS